MSGSSFHYSEKCAESSRLDAGGANEESIDIWLLNEVRPIGLGYSKNYNRYSDNTDEVDNKLKALTQSIADSLEF